MSMRFRDRKTAAAFCLLFLASAGAARAEDFYSTLGLERGASAEAVKQAYRRAAMKFHPDRNPGNPAEAERKFKAVKEAYEVLSDPERRALYDRTGRYTTSASASASSSASGATSPPGAPPRPPAPATREELLARARGYARETLRMGEVEGEAWVGRLTRNLSNTALSDHLEKHRMAFRHFSSVAEPGQALAETEFLCREYTVDALKGYLQRHRAALEFAKDPGWGLGLVGREALQEASRIAGSAGSLQPLDRSYFSRYKERYQARQAASAAALAGAAAPGVDAQRAGRKDASACASFFARFKNLWK